MPSVQRRVSPNGKISYRALVRLKNHKTKTATFLKRADAVSWSQETETKIKQSKYFPDRLIESENYTLYDLLDRYKSEILTEKRAKDQSERTGRSRTSATVNRCLTLLSHAFTMAVR